MSSLTISIDYDRGVPLYRQIYEGVAVALARGAFRRGERLPTIHELARQLEVNPNTVARAYRELERSGYLVGERGRGTFPAERTKPSPAMRENLLKRIVDQALTECSRVGLRQADLIDYLKRDTS